MELARIVMTIGLALALLTACGGGETPSETIANSATRHIEGEAFYRERIMPPPGAILTVALEDVSRMDVPADRLAEYRQEIDGAPPYAFTLEYDPAAIDGRMRYNVRATIHEGDKLRFTSTESTDPFGLGEDETLRIMMSGVGGERPGAGPVEPDRDMRAVVSRDPRVGLEATHWRLQSLGGEEIRQPDDPEREAHFLLDPETEMIGAFGSCNGFRGGYTLSGNQLSFGPLASTQKMCADFMDLEQGLGEALAATVWFSIQERRLVLLGADRKPVASFIAVEP